MSISEAGFLLSILYGSAITCRSIYHAASPSRKMGRGTGTTDLARGRATFSTGTGRCANRRSSRTGTRPFARSGINSVAGASNVESCLRSYQYRSGSASGTYGALRHFLAVGLLARSDNYRARTRSCCAIRAAGRNSPLSKQLSSAMRHHRLFASADGTGSTGRRTTSLRVIGDPAFFCGRPSRL